MDWWFQFAKPKIKSFFRWKTNQKYSSFRLRMDMLHRVLKNSYNNYITNPVELSNINRVKGKILSLQRRFSEEYTQINETRVAGESVSTFQFEKRRRARTVFDKLLSEDGRVIDQEGDIRQHNHTYYTQLYSDEDLG